MHVGGGLSVLGARPTHDSRQLGACQRQVPHRRPLHRVGKPFNIYIYSNPPAAWYVPPGLLRSITPCSSPPHGHRRSRVRVVLSGLMSLMTRIRKSGKTRGYPNGALWPQHPDPPSRCALTPLSPQQQMYVWYCRGHCFFIYTIGSR